MNEHEMLDKARREGFDCAMSLAAAIQGAGGSVESVYKKLKEGITFEDFVSMIAAQNGIRFTFEPFINRRKV